MDSFTGILLGFSVAFQPYYLTAAFVGAVLGTAIGVIPGIGPAVAISLLLPVAFQTGDSVGAFILFGGIFYGAMFGGSTTAILVKTPGETASIVTTLDGYEMAKKGRAGAALATSAIGSFVAGTIATFLLMLLARPLADLAIRFGPHDYFAVMILALCTVTAIGGGSPIKAAVATLIGLAIGMVGLDMNSGQLRFTFGSMALFDGVDVVVAAISLFAVSEVLFGLGNLRRQGKQQAAPVGSLLMTAQEWRRSFGAWLRGSGLGFMVGILPGTGMAIAAFASYAAEVKISKRPQEFGNGAIEGVAGPEAANNAAAGAGLVPLLALGIPGNATGAVMLAGLQGYGINPGPLLLDKYPTLVWGLIASLYIGNIMLLVLNLPLIGLWVRLLRVPHALLYPMILAFCVIGVWSTRHEVVDLYIMVVLGLFGFVLRLFRFPLAPLILGLVLGPMLETEFRRALVVSHGDWMVFFVKPFSLAVLVFSAAFVLLPIAWGLWKRRPAQPAR